MRVGQPQTEKLVFFREIEKGKNYIAQEARQK